MYNECRNFRDTLQKLQIPIPTFDSNEVSGRRAPPIFDLAGEGGAGGTDGTGVMGGIPLYRIPHPSVPSVPKVPSVPTAPPPHRSNHAVRPNRSIRSISFIRPNRSVRSPVPSIQEMRGRWRIAVFPAQSPRPAQPLHPPQPPRPPHPFRTSHPAHQPQSFHTPQPSQPFHPFHPFRPFRPLHLIHPRQSPRRGWARSYSEYSLRRDDMFPDVIFPDGPPGNSQMPRFINV